MKKVGILTHYHNSINYGGVLQAYALCKKIEFLGYECEQIDIEFLSEWKNLNFSRSFIDDYIKKIKFIKKIYIKFSKIKNGKKIKRNKLIRKTWEDSFTKFSKIIIPHSDELYNSKTIHTANGKYDIFVVGSDQVWNPIYYYEPFFLTFVTNAVPKIAYAASISQNQLSDNVKKLYSQNLRDFRAISVREESAVHLLSEIVDNHIEHVLDPTLLLDKNDWDAITDGRIEKEPYLFCYFLGDDENMRTLAKEFAIKKQVKLVNICHATGIFHKSDISFGDVSFEAPTPNEFLSLIKYAEYIFTDSFHASVFSLIYQRQFFVFSRQEFKSMGTRLYSLTLLFNVEDRFCDTIDKVNIQYIEKIIDIDYSRRFDMFEEMKQKSITYLKNSLAYEP